MEFKSKLPKTNWDFWLSTALAVVFLSLAIVANATAYELFCKFHFTSDGFHYFSALRNFSNYLSLWEGPTFEYILGNHSYLTLYLLAPLELIFPSAYLLGFINVNSHFFTGLIFVACSYKLVSPPFRWSISWLLGVFYVTFPSVVSGYFSDVYMFQPDYLLPPLLGLLFLSALSNWQRIFTILGALILLTKEEYILLLPAFILVVLHCKSMLHDHLAPCASQLIRRQFLVSIARMYLITSALSLLVLFWFRSLNEMDHAVRSTFNIISIFDWNVLLSSIKGAFERVFPLFPFLLLIFVLSKSAQILFTAFYLIAVPVGRYLLNHAVYGNPLGTPWSNVLIPPMLFIVVLTIIGFASFRLPKRMFTTICCTTLVLSTTYSTIRSFDTDPAKSILGFLAKKITPRFNLTEIDAIRSTIPYARASGYVVIEEYLMGSFMDRSHASEGWVLRKPQSIRNKILREADYLILKKNSQLAVDLLADKERFVKIFETPTFVSFQPVR